MKCPTCFHALSMGSEITFVCVGSCEPAPHPGGTATRGYQVMTKPTFKTPIEELQRGSFPSCRSCGAPSRQEACRHCAARIPTGWRESKVTCIAMAGARATGKSLAIAVAKEQLGLLVERHHHDVLSGVGETDALFQRNYRGPLFEQRRLLQPTASMAEQNTTTTRDSLVFQFRERSATGQTRNRIVVMRDVAGEDLEAQGGMDDHLSFFSRADAVIALLDPLAVKQIQAMLRDLIPGDTRVSEADGLAVLRHVLGLMNSHRPTGRTAIPLAVVLSKFDTLQALRDVQSPEWSAIMNRPGSPLQRDPSLSRAEFDQDDGDLLHEEVRGLLQRLQATQLDAMLRQRVDEYHFFAISALGASPQGDVISSGGIAPFRVLDPFKWALSVAR